MPRSAEVISHWHHSVEGLSTSTLDFYTALERALKAKETPVAFERTTWNERGLLSAKREYLRVSLDRLSFDICAAPFGKDFFFSWWLSKRTPDFAALHGCLAIAGVPFLFLWFIATMGFYQGIFYALVFLVSGVVVLKKTIEAGVNGVEDTILAIPVLGALYQRFLKPVTYYSEDTRMMFEETVHRVVMDVVSGILTVHKMTPLSEAEKQAHRKEER